MARQEDIFVALDIGSTKVCAVVGAVGQTISVTGVDTQEPSGLTCGVVTDIPKTISAITKAIDAVSRQTSTKIREVYVSVSGIHTKGMKVTRNCSLKNEEVRQSDIEHILEEASELQKKKVPGCEVIHNLPQEYFLDVEDKIIEGTGIKKPVGLSALEMTASSYMIATNETALRNIERCCTDSNLKVVGIVSSGLASSCAVLSQEEKELGVALVDIGGGTSDISIWCNGFLVHTKVLDWAGELITSDISKILSTSFVSAEKIKIDYGCACPEKLEDKMAEFEVTKVGGREPEMVSRLALCQEIIQPRVNEILDMINRELEESGYKNKLSAGVVLTGGTSSLCGLADVGQQIFGLPTRIGSPLQVDGLYDAVMEPKYSTAVGLLHYAAEDSGLSSDQGISRDNGSSVLANLLAAFKDLLNI